MIDKAKTLEAFLNLLDGMKLTEGEVKLMTVYLNAPGEKIEIEIKLVKKTKHHLVLINKDESA